MVVLGWIFFGALVGWLAGFFLPQPKRGCMVNIALGLAGSLLGGFIFQTLSGGNFSYETSGGIVSTLVAVIGAVIVLAIWNALHNRR